MEKQISFVTAPTREVVETLEGDKDNSNEILVFENGTVLGAISCDFLNFYSNTNSNDDVSGSNLNLPQLKENISMNSSMPAQKSVNHEILIVSTKIIPHQQSNDNIATIKPNINQNDINTFTTSDHNASLIDRSNYEVDNDNYSVNNYNNNTNNCYISNNQIDLLNSSICSFESRLSLNRNKRFETVPNTTPNRTKSITKLSKSDPNHELYDRQYNPPQYTAIYFDAAGNAISTNNSNIIGGGSAVTGGGGGISSVVNSYFSGRSFDNLNHIYQYQQYAGGDLANNIGIVNDVGVSDGSNQYGTINGVDNNRSSSAIDVIQRRSGCFRQWFTRPSLPFVIGVLALGGVACTLGGIVLGSTGLVEHSTQYLSAALLMIGIGVSLLVISGAIWRLSIPDEVENCPCFRHLETCRNCNSPYCGNRFLTTHNGYMYPEFQHRPPPPSYVTSLNECTVGLLFHHEVANLQRNDSNRMSTPPPAYRSSQSLSVFVPLHSTAVSSSQRNLIPELPVLTRQLTVPEIETVQVLIQSDTESSTDDMPQRISQALPKVMSTVQENSCPLNKNDGVPNLSEISIE